MEALFTLGAFEVLPTREVCLGDEVLVEDLGFLAQLRLVGGRDGAALAEQMRGFEASKAMRLTNAQREGAAALFTSVRTDETETAQSMRYAYEHSSEIIDPHTAIGLHAARVVGLPADVPVVKALIIGGPD